PTVPIVLALDLDRREAGRERSARHYVLRSDRMRSVVEVDEIAGANVHSADTEPHLTGVDPVEVDKPLERAFQQLGLVEARSLESTARVEPGSRLPESEKARRTGDEGVARTELVEDRAPQVAFRSEAMGGRNPVEQGIGGDLLPEGAQPRDPLGRLVSRDNGCIDGANGHAGNPVRVNIGLSQRLVDAGLVSPKRASTLQHQRNAFEREPPFGCPGLRLKLKIHGGASFFSSNRRCSPIAHWGARTTITVAASPL